MKRSLEFGEICYMVYYNGEKYHVVLSEKDNWGFFNELFDLLKDMSLYPVLKELTKEYIKENPVIDVKSMAE